MGRLRSQVEAIARDVRAARTLGHAVEIVEEFVRVREALAKARERKRLVPWLPGSSGG